MTPLHRLISRTNKSTGYGWAFVKTTEALIRENQDAVCEAEKTANAGG